MRILRELWWEYAKLYPELYPLLSRDNSDDTLNKMFINEFENPRIDDNMMNSIFTLMQVRFLETLLLKFYSNLKNLCTNKFKNNMSGYFLTHVISWFH